MLFNNEDRLTCIGVTDSHLASRKNKQSALNVYSIFFSVKSEVQVGYVWIDPWIFRIQERTIEPTFSVNMRDVFVKVKACWL